MINNVTSLGLLNFSTQFPENERKIKNKTEKIRWRKTKTLDIKLNEIKPEKGLARIALSLRLFKI